MSKNKLNELEDIRYSYAVFIGKETPKVIKKKKGRPPSPVKERKRQKKAVLKFLQKHCIKKDLERIGDYSKTIYCSSLKSICSYQTVAVGACLSRHYLRTSDAHDNSRNGICIKLCGQMDDYTLELIDVIKERLEDE